MEVTSIEVMEVMEVNRGGQLNSWYFIWHLCLDAAFAAVRYPTNRSELTTS